MNISKGSLKTRGQWVGAASGAGVPAVSFFTTLAPPLFPQVSVITAALSAAIFLIAALWKPRSESEKGRMPRSATLGAALLAVALASLIAYVLLLQFTTVIGPEGSETRYQIGFGTAGWSLTEVGRQWKETNPAVTPKQLLMYEAAFDQDRVPILWTTSSIYAAGGSLIVLYFLGFICWTSGFALLAKHGSLKKTSAGHQGDA